MRPSLSTRTGDTGQTGLFGGKRLSKSHPRLHAYGDVDELNSTIGLVLCEENMHPQLRVHLQELQRLLFVLGADLATPDNSTAKIDRITPENIECIEQWGCALEAHLPPLQHFILPSGCRSGCLLSHARTICRRAERWVVETAGIDTMNEHAIVFLNRLSDYLFLASRTANVHTNTPEREWIPS